MTRDVDDTYRKFVRRDSVQIWFFFFYRCDFILQRHKHTEFQFHLKILKIVEVVSIITVFTIKLRIICTIRNIFGWNLGKYAHCQFTISNRLHCLRSWLQNQNPIKENYKIDKKISNTLSVQQKRCWTAEAAPRGLIWVNNIVHLIRIMIEVEVDVDSLILRLLPRSKCFHSFGRFVERDTRSVWTCLKSLKLYQLYGFCSPESSKEEEEVEEIMKFFVVVIAFLLAYVGTSQGAPQRLVNPETPYAHPAVLINSNMESQLPDELRNQFYRNPRIASGLAKESWFGNKEMQVSTRIPHSECSIQILIIDIL